MAIFGPFGFNFGGGGTGFALGEPNNIFGANSGAADIGTVTIAASRIIAEATRDAYDTSTPGWLANYTDEDVNIILYYQDNSDRVIQYQRRIGTNWVNNGPAVTALQGMDGSASDLSDVTARHVPVKSSTDEVFIDSGIEVIEDTGTVMIPSNTLGIGDLIELSEATGFGLIHNNVTQDSFVLIDAELSSSTGSARPQQWFIDGSTIQRRSFQPDNSQTITTNPLSVDYTTTIDGSTFDLMLETSAPMTNVKARLIDAATGVPFKYVPSKLAWDNDSLDGFDFRQGTNTINLYSDYNIDETNGVFSLGYSPLILNAGRDLTLEIKADNVALLGNSSGLPAFSGLSGTAEFRPLAYQSETITSAERTKLDGIEANAEVNVQADWSVTDNTSDAYIANKPDIPGDEEIRDVVGATLVAGMNVTIDVDDAANTITINSTGGNGGGTPGPAPADRIYYGLSNSNNPGTVDLTTLTREDDPTNPDTISTGAATSGQYFILLVPQDDDVTSIFDTVLNQDVTSIFSATQNVRVIDTVQYKSYVLGPLSAGVNEQYVINFGG